ncbi:MAG: phosphatidylinositol mannoside acyltransferase [Actinomycetota bacterium]|nr:phosphatidylinositol mannoside acyltransferase [Actinomycetota bacterium]
MSTPRRLLELGSALARPLPIGALDRIGAGIGRLALRRSPQRGRGLAANLARVLPDASAAEIDRLVADGFASYGRYWAETLRLPSLSSSIIDRRFSVDGREHLLASREAGFGPIVVLPHLGGWEWAAAWLTRINGIGVSAVVERLQPEDVFEWFAALRSAYGINVIPLGPGSFPSLTAAVRAKDVVCLLGDRDLTSTGTMVDFFGAPASLPTGPAVLSLRTGAPIHVTAVYFTEAGHHCIVGPPIWPKRNGLLRDDAALLTQRCATALEPLIRRAPEQWHVLEPIWKGDPKCASA